MFLSVELVVEIFFLSFARYETPYFFKFTPSHARSRTKFFESFPPPLPPVVTRHLHSQVGLLIGGTS